MVYTEWRYRAQIEHTYRFDQEDGLDVEDVRVRTLERMRRVFALTLLPIPGLITWSCGFAAWEANSASLETVMALMCSSRASVLS